MKRMWISVALLAGSWMFGLRYFHAPEWPLWIALIAAGAGLLLPSEPRAISRRQGWPAACLLAPALYALPWPYRVAPLMLLLGLLLLLLPFPRRWPGRLGTALADSGAVLLAQAVAVSLYAMFTSRSHELPGVLAWAVSGVARLLGMDAAYAGRDIALFSMRKVHLLGATWELLLDPVTLCFLAGGWALLGIRRQPRAGRLLLAVLLWLPARAGLLMAVLLHRTLLTDYDATLKLMNQFWSAWVLTGLLAGPVVIAWFLVPLSAEPAPRKAEAWTGRRAAGVAALGLAAALLAVGLFWDPAGQRKGGRVLMDEFHTTWEPTQRPFDTTWYGHDAGYNYACLYDYVSRFYDLARLTNRIDDAALANTDVLILKVPTAPYAVDEVDAVLRFTERGGGVLLIGEHTDVYRTSSHLNQVARLFGFEFRKDCLFDIDRTFEQSYIPALVPHPVVQNLPLLDFAVSCSIAPGLSPGRAVILSTGLWSLPADYHASNFYPQVEDRAEMRYGAFVQLWAARRGAGRVLAYTDSTQFSNFCVFEPGKSEVLLAMIAWLNHSNRHGDPGTWFLGAAVLLAGGAWFALRGKLEAPLWQATVLCGFCLATTGVRACHRAALPLPTPVRPLTRVVIDRTVCDAPLARCGFIKSSPEGFGIFEQWILKLGYFTARCAGDAAFSGDLLIFMHPDQPVTETFARKLAAYVNAGGKVLVIDSDVNKQSKANSLLYPFGLSVETSSSDAGMLSAPAGWPAVAADGVRAVRGGEPLVRLGGKVVAASQTHGKGTVTVIGFGARFNDDNMGVTTDLEPAAELRQVYELQFALLRQIVEKR